MDVAGPQLRRAGLRLPAWLAAEDGRSHPVPSGRPIIVADTPSLVAVVSGAISAGDKLVQTLLDSESERAYNKPVDLDDEALLRQLQDLFAALEIGHGDYALGVARSFKVMVEARGIEIRAYDPEVARWFRRSTRARRNQGSDPSARACDRRAGAAAGRGRATTIRLKGSAGGKWQVHR